MAGLASALASHHRIGLDTPVFIYYIEDVSRYATVAGTVFEGMDSGAFQGITSVLTLMELAVKPLQLRRPDIADEYSRILSRYPNLSVAPLDAAGARLAAELRAAHRLRPADALQAAACLQYGATAFVTNDKDLRRLTELQVIVLDDFMIA